MAPPPAHFRLKEIAAFVAKFRLFRDEVGERALHVRAGSRRSRPMHGELNFRSADRIFFNL
jgi:hypothetical protein